MEPAMNNQRLNIEGMSLKGIVPVQSGEHQTDVRGLSRGAEGRLNNTDHTHGRLTWTEEDL